MLLPPLLPGNLIRRYQRFLADVTLADGRVVTAHCPNSGSMKTCWAPGWPVLLSESANPTRRLKYTWELVHNGTCWIGINTQRPNRLAEEAIQAGTIAELTGYDELHAEVWCSRHSRIDLMLNTGPRQCFVEVKNVTLIGADGAYCFPDSVTERGRKHLRELRKIVRQGQRGVMLYVIQRSDGTHFRPAWEIDPEYAKELRLAHRSGVEILAYRASVTPGGITLTTPVPWSLDKP